jgi:hypothetical protein
VQQPRRRDAEQLEERRHEIDERRVVRDADAHRHQPGRAQDERDVQDLFVERLVVPLPAVLAEFLAVVAREDDERPLVEAEGVQALEQASDLVVGVERLAGVGMAVADGGRGGGGDLHLAIAVAIRVGSGRTRAGGCRARGPGTCAGRGRTSRPGAPRASGGHSGT